MDIFLSHDWPLGIEQHGDLGGLIREKPFFKEDVR
jgi:lariat debranching enzyme